MTFEFMTATQFIGWMAAALTFLTFICRDMRRLRVLALAANGAFVTYALMAGLWPVLALHLALAPINLWRLLQLNRGPAPSVAPGERPPAGPLQPDAGSRPVAHRNDFKAIERKPT